MIPFFTQPSFSLGPLTIHAFGVIVAIAAAVGLSFGERRFRELGLDRSLGERFAWWAVVCGFLGAHLFSVLFYFPREVVAHPVMLIRVWENISSFGGILGGMIGIWAFFHFRAKDVDRTTRLAYVDAAAFVFPISLMIGRIACALAHDHPGTVTKFPLAISLQSAAARRYITNVYSDAGRLAELPSPQTLGQYGFHDLGWYEFLYLAVFLVPVMLLLGRRPRPTGFFLGAFIVLYMPVRFLLDFLRVADVRYAGLTPAQWAALAALLGLVIVLASPRRKSGPHPVPADTTPEATLPTPNIGSTDVA